MAMARWAPAVTNLSSGSMACSWKKRNGVGVRTQPRRAVTTASHTSMKKARRRLMASTPAVKGLHPDGDHRRWQSRFLTYPAPGMKIRPEDAPCSWRVEWVGGRPDDG